MQTITTILNESTLADSLMKNHKIKNLVDNLTIKLNQNEKFLEIINKIEDKNEFVKFLIYGKISTDEFKNLKESLQMDEGVKDSFNKFINFLGDNSKLLLKSIKKINLSKFLSFKDFYYLVFICLTILPQDWSWISSDENIKNFITFLDDIDLTKYNIDLNKTFTFENVPFFVTISLKLKILYFILGVSIHGMFNKLNK